MHPYDGSCSSQMLISNYPTRRGRQEYGSSVSRKPQISYRLCLKRDKKRMFGDGEGREVIEKRKLYCEELHTLNT
jgi:hypothetical protein